jgi:membrane AbrB-like protein
MLLGSIGYLAFFVFSLPAPALLGTLAIVGTANLLGVIPVSPPPPQFNIIMQMLLGLFVGAKITPGVYNEIKKIILPAGFMSLWALSIGLGVGYLLSLITGMDISTAVLGASPAGLAEMSIVALSVGADVGSVSFLQVYRLMLTLLIFPFLARRSKTGGKKQTVRPSLKDRIYSCYKEQFSYAYLKFIIKDLTKLKSGRVIFAVAVAVAGGLLGEFLSLPAGGMLGALFAVSAVSLGGVPLETPPVPVHRIMQIGIGVMIGFNITHETIFLFREMLVPISVLSFFVLSTSLIMAWVIKKTTGWDNTACLIAAAPSGFTPMTILAYELGAKPLEVTLLHLTRLLTIKILIPFIVKLM